MKLFCLHFISSFITHLLFYCQFFLFRHFHHSILMSVPKYPLLRNVHATLTNPGEGENFLTKANYYYHHYGCDGFNDAVSDIIQHFILVS